MNNSTTVKKHEWMVLRCPPRHRWQPNYSATWTVVVKGVLELFITLATRKVPLNKAQMLCTAQALRPILCSLVHSFMEAKSYFYGISDAPSETWSQSESTSDFEHDCHIDTYPTNNVWPITSKFCSFKFKDQAIMSKTSEGLSQSLMLYNMAVNWYTYFDVIGK